MKRAAIIILALIISFGILGMTAYADESVTREYIVSEEGGVYTLSQRTDGEPSAVARGSLDDILKRIMCDASDTRIVFDEVYIGESFEFPKGGYTVSGDISLDGDSILTVADGTSLECRDMTVTFADESLGFIRIKGGSVSIYDSEISGASGGSFLLDYSSKSSLTLISGRVSSMSESATVDLRTGSLDIRGGAIENTAGAAVSNDAHMSLGGSPEIIGIGYDILTEKPIYLTSGELSYSGKSLSVLYRSLFERGTLSEVFYSVYDEAAFSGISLFDSVGKKYDLTHFESSKYNGEENFAAVYLPFSVKLYDKTGLSGTVYKLKDERLDDVSATEFEGYEFSGWYIDEGGNNKFSFETTITDDMSLYAVYKLLPPTFAATSYSGVYDAKEHSIGIKTLSHPLATEGGFFTYEWYLGDRLVSRESVLKVKYPRESGVYSCNITFNYSSDAVKIVVGDINVLIQKATVIPPEISSKVYTGSSLSADIKESSIYNISEHFYTNVGAHPVVLTLTEPDNYSWKNSDADSITLHFNIDKAENLWTEKISVYDIYYGAEYEFLAKSLFGDVKYKYSKTEDGAYFAVQPKEVGSYYVKAYVDETDNYFAIESEPIKFAIIAESVTALSVVTPPRKTEYFAFEKFIGAGLTLEVLYNSGRSEVIGIEKVALNYQNGDSFRYGDNAVILSYGGVSVNSAVTVKRAKYDITKLDFTDTLVTYNGKYQTITVMGDDIIGDDGISLKTACEGGGTNVGTYTVTLSFFSDSRNYEIPEPITVLLTIAPMTVKVNWYDTAFIYDGTEKSPRAAYTDTFGVLRYPKVSGAKVDAGGDYTATIDTSDTNYIFDSPSVSFEIRKADYDFSEVKWSASSFIYDGTERSVSVSGLPAGVRLVGYTDAIAKDAGAYTAVASLLWDEKNYNSPPKQEHTWVIYPAEYDLSGFTVTDGEFIYDGEIHYPTVMGKLPIGNDGIEVTYTFSGGATHVSDGKVEVTVSFHTESKNYLTPDEMIAYVTVKPLGINVLWQSEKYVYDGNEHIPGAKASECQITVSGAEINAGNYIASAATADSDYYVINSTYEFTIERAENAWCVPPSISDIFFGGTLSPMGEVLAGDVAYSYFSDVDCTVAVANPTSCGIYYMVASSEGDENHLPISYEPQAFEIIAILPVSMSVEILAERLTAFYKLVTDDLLITVTNNDGSVYTEDINNVIVIYENGESLRYGDATVGFVFEGIEISLPIEVHRADYDMSGVIWENITHIYDGTEKSPGLSGLPLGVSVREYTTVGMTRAGTYTVGAIFEYDSENFNEPRIEPCEFVIEKAEISIPKFGDTIYNGMPQFPNFESEYYYLPDCEEMKNAGAYTVKLVLYDGENYCFAGTDTNECAVIFNILPIILEVTVSDYDLYLWDDIGYAEYVLFGEILGGDEVRLEQYIADDMIYCKSANPNYELSVSPGRVNRLPHPSPDMTEKLLFRGMIILIILLLIIMSILYRRRIHDAIAIARCRIKNRKPYVPTSLEVSDKKAVLTNTNDVPKEKDENADIAPIIEVEKHTEISQNDDADFALSIDSDRADELITDSLAKDLLKKGRETVYTSGTEKSIINVDTLSKNFTSGDKVDVNVLKSRSLVPYDTAYIKVLARGAIDKPLSVYANDFSLAAIKMIALTGGEAVKVVTVKEKENKNKT